MGLSRDIFRLAPSGIVYDLPPDAVEQGIFNSGRNVSFRDGLPERVGGYRPVFGTPLHEAEYLINVRDPVVNWWMYPGQSAIGVTDGTLHYDITPTAGLDPTTTYNQWTGGILNGIAVVNNEWNNPLYWPGQSAQECVDLPGWPAGTKARVLRPFKYHLFAMNVTDQNGIFPDMVVWSDAAEPGAIPQSWSPTPANQAGFAALSAGGGGIVDAAQLRDQLVIFKDGSTWICSYVGGNDIFAFRKVLETSGLLGNNCAVEIKGMMVALSDSDVIAFDGQQAQSLLDKKNRKWMFNQLDPVNYRNSYVVRNWLESEVWVCFPTVGNQYPNMALVWSRDDNTWGVREINAPTMRQGLVAPSVAIPTWDAQTATWLNAVGMWDAPTYQAAAETILASVDGELVNYDGSNTNDGVNIQAVITKSGVALGDPQTRKLIKRVWPRIDAPYGTQIYIRAGGHDQPNGSVAWAAPVLFTVGEDEKVDTFAQGRYMAIEVASDGNQPWRMSGFDVEYSTVGGW